MASDDFTSPVDLADPAETGAPLRWTAVSLAVASLFLLATNSIALKSWIDEQTPGPLQSQAAARADQWHAQMTRLGFATPRAKLNKLWLRAEATDQR